QRRGDARRPGIGGTTVMTMIYVFGAQRGLVAQICNLPYRRFVIGRASESSSALALADVPQNAILRYIVARQSRNQTDRDPSPVAARSTYRRARQTGPLRPGTGRGPE